MKFLNKIKRIQVHRENSLNQPTDLAEEASFVSTKSFSPVSEIHRSLCHAYFQDFAKYGSRIDRDCLVHAGGSENGKMYYWSRAQKSSAAEVDYLLVRNGEIVPVEVKSGSLGRLKSLQVFMDEHPAVKRGVVMASSNVKTIPGNPVKILPLFSRLAACRI